MDARIHDWLLQCPCTVTLSNGAVTFLFHISVSIEPFYAGLKALLAVAVVDGPGVSLSAASSVRRRWLMAIWFHVVQLS